MSQVIVNSEENLTFMPEQTIEPDYLIILAIPSETMRVRTIMFARASNLTSDSYINRTVTAEPLTPDELADVSTSRTEMAREESRHFDNVDDALSWLESE